MRRMLVPVILALCAFCSLVDCCYLAKQGRYILGYEHQSRDVDKVLADTATPADVKRLLQLSADIRRFAVDSLGLTANKNYTTFVATDRTYLVDVVSACEPDTFRAYTWWFPFFGRFPYKGFFEREDALKLAEKLKRKDLDVSVRKADAFSTLGFFSDPLYSYMKNYSVFQIASLLIHEQTHATIFRKSQIDFNEQLASFVGDEGALAYIRSRYGPDSEEFRQALVDTTEYRHFIRFVRGIYDSLDAAYRSGLDREQRLVRKQSIIADAKERYVREHGNSRRAQRFKSADVNNAYLFAYMTYNQDLDLYYRLYDRNGRDLRKTVAQLKGIPKKGAKEYLERVLLGTGSHTGEMRGD